MGSAFEAWPITSGEGLVEQFGYHSLLYLNILSFHEGCRLSQPYENTHMD